MEGPKPAAGLGARLLGARCTYLQKKRTCRSPAGLPGQLLGFTLGWQEQVYYGEYILCSLACFAKAFLGEESDAAWSNGTKGYLDHLELVGSFR